MTNQPTCGQRQVLDLLILGCSNTDIARQLGINRRTVQNRLIELYRHFGVSGRANGKRLQLAVLSARSAIEARAVKT